MKLVVDTDTGPPKETAHSRVYAALSDALMNGDFVPGQRLVVRQVAETFSTSAMPVREALKQLVSDEALFDHPNRGVIVPEASAEVIHDLVRVRCAVEGAATEWAASTINDEQLGGIRLINERMIASAKSGNAADYLSLNRDFHFSVYGASRSQVMLPVIERLWLRAGPWLNIMRGEATLGMGLDHHAEIMDALKQGDGLRARRALVEDIRGAGDLMLRALARPIDSPPARRRRRPADAIAGA
jgi:DNA-binding GntR family transcriptional regulator